MNAAALRPRACAILALALPLALLATIATWTAPAGAARMGAGDTLVVAFDVPEEPVLQTIPRPQPGTGPLADMLRVGIEISRPSFNTPGFGNFVVELFRGSSLLATLTPRMGTPGESLIFTEQGSAFTFGTNLGITGVAPGLSNLARAGESGTVRITLLASSPQPVFDVRVALLDFSRGQSSNSAAEYAPDGVIRSQLLASATPVPAPPAVALLAAGLLGLAALRRAGAPSRTA